MKLIERIKQVLIEQGHSELCSSIDTLDCNAFRVVLNEAYDLGREDGYNQAEEDLIDYNEE